MPVGAETISSLLKMMVKDYQTAQTKRREEKETGIGILQQVAEMFGPGYLKGEETKTLAAMEQGMVGRGLGGTTRPAAVSAGIKADIRGRQKRAQAGAMTNIANFMAGFQDIYPQPGTLAHLATGGFSGALDLRKLDLAEQEASRGYDPFGRPIAPAGGRGGGGGSFVSGGTTGGGWTPSGQSTTTGSSYTGLGAKAVNANAGGAWPTMAPFGGAIYGSQEAFEASLEPETGSVPMGRRTGPTIKEPVRPSGFGPSGFGGDIWLGGKM